MKNFLALVCIIFLSGTSGICADSTATAFRKNIIFLEAGGKGPVYSLNYERIFRQGKKLSYSYRLGFSILREDFSVPVAFTAFTSPGSHHLELSLGLTPEVHKYRTFLSGDNLSDKYLYITPGIGYRYQKREGRLMVSAGVSPLIFFDPPSDDVFNVKPEFKPSAQLALGFCF
ncbi:hypothetical protein GXP67_22875 [Rhodocytophaga rosea]|uniref:Outer membrane protein beta-barrel domain-containing protein n=1 Tax=Rhodocytophaga rosea TaxID=2704465 RepID=A0A6C0GMK7_9BACT|nr:hypothetical protein [Rhodocytophaga rosea]QHT69276.1 hypothetical protein GXP67_22875 [Rhodocytophaga rosea]